MRMVLSLLNGARLFILAGSLFFISASHGATPFQLVIDEKIVRDLQKEEVARLNEFLTDVVNSLPQRFSYVLQRFVGEQIQVTFSQLDQENEIIGRISRSSHSRPMAKTNHGWYSSSIEIHRSILQSILNGPERASTLDSFHRNSDQFAKALLIHELSHLYDLKGTSSIWDSLLDWGTQIGRISSDPQFLNLAGWEMSNFGSKWNQKNSSLVGSIDPYEKADPQESFAVNMEFFLLDPEFKCRRPALYLYLNKNLNHTPFPEFQCEINTEVPVWGSGMGSGQPEFAKIDPDRLYEIHYLMASPGKEMISGWGHSMFRLVMCRPDREEMGPACLTEDISEHWVVGYQARMDLTQTRPWSLLLGSHYPSQLIPMRFIDVLEEYNKDELRDLVSIPLKLTKGQSKLFIYKLIEDIWNYRGQYTFFTSNCATEAKDLLNCCFDGLIDGRSCRAHTPLGILQEIANLGLTEQGLLQKGSAEFVDEKQAEKQGYWIPSKLEQLKQSLQLLNEAGLSELTDERWKSWDIYSAELKAEERLQKYQELVPQVKDSWMQTRVSSAFFVLESQVSRMKQRDLIKKVRLKLSSGNKSDNEWNHPFQSGVNSNLNQSLVNFGYGIPKRKDIHNIIVAQLELEKEKFQKAQEELSKKICVWFSDDCDEIRKIRLNIKLFLGNIKKSN